MPAQSLRGNIAFRAWIGEDRELRHDLVRLEPEVQSHQAVAPDQEADLIAGILFFQRPERIDRVGFSFPFALNIRDFHLLHITDSGGDKCPPFGIRQDLPLLVRRNRRRHKEDTVHNPLLEDVPRQSCMPRVKGIKRPAEHGNFHNFLFSP